MSKSTAIASSLVLSIEGLGDYETVELTRNPSTVSLNVAPTIDTEEKWENQQTFNWFGSGHEGSATPKQFLNSALDSEGNGPLSKMAQSTKIETDCNQEIDSESAESILVGVTDITSDDYSKHIEMEMGGEYPTTMQMYIGFSPTNIFALQWTEEESDVPSVNRVAFKYNPQTKIFAFEYFSRMYGEVFADKSYNHYRVAIDENTDELRVSTVMGTSEEENLTFLGLQGNFEEAEAGAAFYRVGPPNIEDQFICVNVDNGNFVNTTGCSENSEEDRVHEFNLTTPSYLSSYAIDHADWKGDETVRSPSFDLDTILTAEVAN